MRFAGQSPSAWVLGGAATAGVLVLATAAIPSIPFLPRQSEPVRANVSIRFAPPQINLGAYKSVIEHPLFNPSRAPDPSAPAQSATAPAIPPLSEFRLEGIVTSKDGGFALVEQRSTKQVLTLHSGETFAGRQVKDILETGVDLTGPLGAERLTVPKADAALPAASQRTMPKLTRP
jgi:hypothetical protein